MAIVGTAQESPAASRGERGQPVATIALSRGHDPSGPSLAQGDSDLDGLIASMPVEDRVGQLLMLGFEGTSAAGAESQIRELRAGGIVLLSNGDSAEGVRQLIGDLR